MRYPSPLAVAFVAGCSYAGPAPIDPAGAALLGCYDVRLFGWTEAHEARLGFDLPSAVQLHEREVTAVDLRDTGVEGVVPAGGTAAGRLLLPARRDIDSRWWRSAGEGVADSLYLHWGSLNASVRLGIPADSAPQRGTLRWWPDDYDEDLALTVVELAPATCAN